MWREWQHEMSRSHFVKCNFSVRVNCGDISCPVPSSVEHIPLRPEIKITVGLSQKKQTSNTEQNTNVTAPIKIFAANHLSSRTSERQIQQTVIYHFDVIWFRAWILPCPNATNIYMTNSLRHNCTVQLYDSHWLIFEKSLSTSKTTREEKKSYHFDGAVNLWFQVCNMKEKTISHPKEIYIYI